MSGTVIIRLQNLPLEARSIDIRRFFDGLVIPDGGVHIIGGERGDAFIAFESDEDARLAMARDGYLLCNSKIKLLLSSKTEMQTVVAAVRNQLPLASNSSSTALNKLSNLLPNSQSSASNGTSMDLLSKLLSSANNSSNNLAQQAKSLPSSDSITSLNNLISNKLTANNDSVKSLPTITPSDLLNQIKTNFGNTASTANSSNSFSQVNSNQATSNKLGNSDIFDLIQNKFKTNNNNANNNSNNNGTNSNTLSNDLSSMLSSVSAILPSILNSTNLKEKSHNETNYSEQSNAASNNSYNNNRNFNQFKKQSPNNYPDDDASNNNNSNRWSNNFDNNKKNFGKGSSNGNYASSNFNNNSNNGNNGNFPIKRKFQDTGFGKTTNFVEPSGPPNKSFSSSQKLDPIIRVKNFNSNSSYKDVRTFLQGIQIEHDGIKLLTDSRGNRNGMAFVKVMTITDLKKALCRNGQFFEDRQIEVFQSSEEEFNSNPSFDDFKNNKQQFANNPNNNGNNGFNGKRQDSYQKSDPSLDNMDNSLFFIKIYGLPAEFDESELKNMFNNVRFKRIVTSKPTPISSTVTTNGVTEQTTVLKAKKLCQVETQLDLEKALTRQNERVGKSKLQIFQISRAEYERELNSIGLSLNPQDEQDISNANNDNTNNQNVDFDAEQQSDDLFVYMTGVPFSARELDVKNFFQDLNVVSINLLCDTETLKPTGECCCHFLTKQDRDKALEKDDKLFRNRVVKVKSITYNEYQQQVSDLAQVKQKQQALMKRKHANPGNNYNNRNVNEFNNENENENGNGNDSFENYDDNNYNNNNNNNNNNNRKFNSKPNSQNNNNNNNNRPIHSNNSNNNFRSFNSNYNNNNSQNGQFQNSNNNGSLKRRALNNDPPMNSNNSNNFKRIKPSNNFHHTQQQPQQYHKGNNNNTGSLVDLPPLPPELQKYRNCLVLLSNVSHDASREDILELFKIYSPIDKTLKMRQDDSGKPTGDAIIACQNMQDARDACDSLNGVDFMGRNIKAVLL